MYDLDMMRFPNERGMMERVRVVVVLILVD